MAAKKLPAPAKSSARAPKPAEVELTFASVKEWASWLERHHASSPAVMLRIPKGDDRAFGYTEALEVALAWGWIDSHKRTLDERAWLQRFGPRTPRSPWSKINCDKAEALIAAGKMKPAGLSQVELAKADGRWERAYTSARTSSVPDDLAEALAKNAKARKFFEQLDGANRYAILWRLQTAKKPETRRARLEKFVAMCARGERIHERG
ncbi:MAG: YdeI/OmpD-associated family protein [Myxococcales bacterium]